VPIQYRWLKRINRSTAGAGRLFWADRKEQRLLQRCAVSGRSIKLIARALRNGAD
jgi:hypothetical protein